MDCKDFELLKYKLEELERKQEELEKKQIQLEKELAEVRQDMKDYQSTITEVKSLLKDIDIEIKTISTKVATQEVLLKEHKEQSKSIDNVTESLLSSNNKTLTTLLKILGSVVLFLIGIKAPEILQFFIKK